MSLFCGEKVDAQLFWKKFDQQIQHRSEWSLPPLNHEVLFSCLEKMRSQLLEKSNLQKKLSHDLLQIVREDELASYFEALINFISPHHLRTKLRRELGTDFPFELRRISLRENHFECWFPMGTLVHMTPNNSPLLNVFALIEGLISGNVNLLKLARKDTDFAEIFFEELGALDLTGELKKYIYIHKVSSQSPADLKKFLSVADVISAWGNEESLTSIKSLAPPEARLVEWGHKISASYIARSQSKNPEVLTRLAEEICINEQQSCSSPQVVYLETTDPKELREWAKLFSISLDQVSKNKPQAKLDSQEQAEITIQCEQIRLSEALAETLLIKSPRNDWRLFVEDNPGLRASPLFRTLWIKPMEKNKILETLSPLRKYLQTLGLACTSLEAIELLPLFYRTGFLRINPIGKMTESYTGEPHDGVYALQRFCKKVTFTDDFGLNGYTSLEMIKRIES
ncbi:MAG: acyl-CoA reductase [Bdellovibrionota bacterium]